jgi:Mn2+/Fe2+ NRAMP family transporter
LRTIVNLLPGISLFELAVATQVVNAIALPLVFYFLIKLTSSKEVMGEFANNRFQKYFAINPSWIGYFSTRARESTRGYKESGA